MDKGDVGFGFLIAGCVAGGLGGIAVVVYIIITVAKFAWGD